VSDCCLTPIHQFFSYIMVRTSLFSTRWWCPFCSRPTRWVGFFIVLAHWNNSPWVDMSLHSDTLVWFRANQSLLFLLNAACLAEKQHIPILMSLVWHDRARPTIYHRRAHKPLCHRCGSKCIRIKRYINEYVSAYCFLMPTQQSFGYIMTRRS
jgi:hypothetical protein